MDPEVTIVLPTYEEAGHIDALAVALLAALDEQPCEILVVDDGSPDGTAALVEARSAEDARVRLIRRSGPRGLTASLRDGLASARGRRIVWMDADFSMPPEAVPRLLAALDGVDVAVGSRYSEGGADRRDDSLARLMSRVINGLGYAVLKGPVRDLTSGFVAVRREVARALPLRGDYGESCIDFLCRARAGGYRIEEVGYVCVPRRTGRSKTATSFWGFLVRGRHYVSTIAAAARDRAAAPRSE